MLDVCKVAECPHLPHGGVSHTAPSAERLCGSAVAALPILRALLPARLSENVAKMSKGCITAIKYFLFLFNLIFFIFGALMMGFGLWILLDNQSFIAVLQEESSSLKVGSYILIGVGSLSMLMGFLGCIGAIYEVRCLLGLYFTCLLLILIAQMTAAVLIYFQRDLLKTEMSTIVNKILVDYTVGNKTTEQAWDFIQRTMQCCGWTGPSNWTENVIIRNSSRVLYSCSCRNMSVPGVDVEASGLCESLNSQPPVYQTGCISSVESWLFSNYGVIIGICAGVAVIELLGIVLSICLCQSIRQEDYTKVPAY
ncbi:CD82 antigen-like [Arapaima gigas]